VLFRAPSALCGQSHAPLAQQRRTVPHVGRHRTWDTGKSTWDSHEGRDWKHRSLQSLSAPHFDAFTPYY
jgi:hypothetical protein